MPIDRRSRPLACIKLIRQYFTFLLNFSSIRFIIGKPFPNSYNDNTDQMSSPIRVNPTIKLLVIGYMQSQAAICRGERI